MGRTMSSQQILTDAEQAIRRTQALAPAAPVTVLHFEDHESTADLVERVLTSSLDVVVVRATEATRSLELVAEHRPGLVLLDLQVGEVDGEDVLELLRSDPQTSSVPIVILSGSVTEARASELLALGATATVAKPFCLDELRDTVRAALEDDHVAPGSPGPALVDAHEDPLDLRLVEALQELGDDSDGVDGVSVLVRTMLADARAHMASLQEAAAAGDTDAAARLAHSLSGGVGNLGAHVVVRHCRQLQDAARDGDAEGVSRRAGMVAAALETAEVALATLFVGVRPPDRIGPP